MFDTITLGLLPRYIEASFLEKQVQISFPVGIANCIISVEHINFEKLSDKYWKVLKRHDTESTGICVKGVMHDSLWMKFSTVA